MNTLKLIILLGLITLILIPSPGLKGNKVWTIGEGGDFQNVMDAVSSNQVMNGDTLYFISNVSDDFYGGYIDKSLTIEGNGFHWRVNRIAKGKQLQIIDSNVVIRNISIEFYGVYTNHLFSLEGSNSSLTLEDIFINISRGGGVNNIVSDIITVSKGGNYTAILKNVYVTQASYIKLTHILKTSTTNTYIYIKIRNVTTTITGEMINLHAENSKIIFIILDDGIWSNTILNTSIINTDLTLNIQNIEFGNGNNIGLYINTTGNSQLSINLDNLKIQNNNKRFIYIEKHGDPNIILNLKNLLVSKTNLLNSSFTINSGLLYVKLSNITFYKSQDKLSLDAQNTQVSLDMDNLTWISESPIIDLNTKFSNLSLSIFNIKVTDASHKALSINTINSSIQANINGLTMNGLTDKIFEAQITNTTANIDINNASVDRAIQIGFTLNLKNSPSNITISNLYITNTDRRLGYINSVNSKANITLSQIRLGQSPLDGLLISGDNKSIINIEGSDLRNASGWSIYIQGGIVNIINTTANKLYATTAKITIRDTAFNEANSLIFHSNTTVTYILTGVIYSNITKTPIKNVTVEVFDKYGKKIADGYTNQYGRFKIMMNYYINDTYLPHPLKLRFKTIHLTWNISTGNYTMENITDIEDIIYVDVYIYEYTSILPAKLLDHFVIDGNQSAVWITKDNKTFTGQIIQIDKKVIYIYFNTDKGSIALIYLIDNRVGLAYYYSSYPPRQIKLR